MEMLVTENTKRASLAGAIAGKAREGTAVCLLAKGAGAPQCGHMLHPELELNMHQPREHVLAALSSCHACNGTHSHCTAGEL